MTAHAKGELLVRTSRTNRDTDEMFYDEREPASATIFDGLEGAELRGALYREGAREYGRCVSKAYVDGADGAEHVGYVFVKREHYGGSSLYSEDPETYLAETWLTLERVVEPARPTLVESVAL